VNKSFYNFEKIEERGQKKFKKIIAHNEEFTVKEVDMSKSGVVVYLSGDY